MSHVRITCDVSLPLNRTLVDLSLALGITKAEVMRRAVTLLALAAEGLARGERVVLVDAEGRVTTRIAL